VLLSGDSFRNLECAGGDAGAVCHSAVLQLSASGPCRWHGHDHQQRCADCLPMNAPRLHHSRWRGSRRRSSMRAGAGNIALDPQIAMDASGNAFAVWSQDDGTQFRIQANRFE
jgi:hypothetical protein